jgi:hypothetical protein
MRTVNDSIYAADGWNLFQLIRYDDSSLAKKATAECRLRRDSLPAATMPGQY